MSRYATLRVRAWDMADALERKFSTATVHVTVVDVNDHTPQFARSFYTLHLMEDIKVNTEVLQLSASDNDDGHNAKITYSYVNHMLSVECFTYSLATRTDTFTIDRNTGILRLIRPLDRETVSQYELIVHATDGGVPSLT